MSYEIANIQAGKVITASQMCVGDIGTLITGGDEGDVVLRAFNGLINLTNPEHTWSVEDVLSTSPKLLCYKQVLLFEPGSKIILEVK